MSKVRVIESLGNGLAQDVEVMDLDPVPRQGDYMSLGHKGVAAHYVVEAVIFKPVFAGETQIIVRVRAVGMTVGGIEVQPQAPLSIPAKEELPMLPPMSLEDEEEVE